MAFHKENLSFRDHQWREGNTSACFSWPSEQTTVSYNETDGQGDAVTTEFENPNWKRDIILGNNATTVFQGERRRFTYSEGFLHQKRKCGAGDPPLGYGNQELSGDLARSSLFLNLPSMPSTSANAEAHGLAMMRFVKECRAAQGAFRGATWFAELADTVRTIRNPAKTLRRGIDDYVRSARRNARKANNGRRPPINRSEAEALARANPGATRAMRGAISDTWLEYQFGWQPLVSDIGNAVLAGLRLSRRLTPRKRVNAVDRKVEHSSINTFSRAFGGTTVDWEYDTASVYSVLFYGAVKIEVDSPALGVTQEWGLRTSDWAPALWEIIPYSFLIDYFSNVGDVVEVLSFPKSDIAWVSRTFRNSIIREASRTRYRSTGLTWPASGAYKVFEYTPSTYKWERTWIDRTPYSRSLTPRLTLEIPGSQQFKKYLNIGALAAGRLLR